MPPQAPKPLYPTGLHLASSGATILVTPSFSTQEVVS